MYKKIIAVLVAAAVMVPTGTVFGLSAKSAVLLDGFAGRVIMEQNAYERLPMASTTKIMTALVAVESGKMEEIVTVSAAAANVEGSSMWLKAGEEISLEGLVYGLMLNSGNDAATAIAQHLGGSVEGFAKMMNDKAAELGLKDTSFTNPHGLDDENHYTTAYDLGQIARAALKNEKFAQIVATKTKTVSTRDDYKRYLSNHNKMLVMYDGADGVKTGFTKRSGRCLVSSASRDGLQLIAVTLNDPNDWADHKEMLDYGFSKYRQETVIRKNDYMRTVPVEQGTAETVSLVAAKEVSVAVTDGQTPKVQYDVPQRVTAPVVKGQAVGSVTVTLDGNTVEQVDLIALEGVEIMPKKTFWDRLLQWLPFLKSAEDEHGNTTAKIYG